MSSVFNISNGHLCKSEPFDAANFGLKSDSERSRFHGNAEVTLRIPNMEDQSNDVEIIIPPPKTQVRNQTDCKSYEIIVEKFHYKNKIFQLGFENFQHNFYLNKFYLQT